MLSNESISLAVQLLQSLKAKGYKGVVPVENTPLAIMSRPTGLNINQNTPLDQLATQLSILTNGTLENLTGGPADVPSDHTVKIDAFIKDFRAATIRHVDYARNVVKPFVIEVCDGCLEYLKTFVPESIAAYEVRVLDTSELFKNATLRAWANSTPSLAMEFRPNLYMADVPVATIREKYLTSHLAGLKKDLDVWAAGLSDDRVLDLWAQFFGDHKSAGTDGSLGAILGVIPTIAPRANYDALLFGLLVSQALENNPPAGVSISLAAFNSEVTLLNDKLRAWYCHEYDTYYSDLKMHAMSWCRSGTVLTVYPESYDEFIAKGGQADAILGRLVSSAEVYTVDEYLSRQAELLSAWEQFTNIRFMATKNERFARARETMISFFAKAIENDADPVIVDKARLIAAFEREVDQLTLEQFSQLSTFQDFVLGAVCKTRFAHTNAYEILAGINRACLANPRLDGREAASLATIEYLPRWMATMIKAF